MNWANAGALYVWTGRFVECLYATVRGNTSVASSVASGPCRANRHKFDPRPLPNTQNQPAPFSLFAPWFWLIYTGHKIIFFIILWPITWPFCLVIFKNKKVSILRIFRIFLKVDKSLLPHFPHLHVRVRRTNSQNKGARWCNNWG